MSTSEAGTRYVVITADDLSANIWVCSIVSVALGTACVIGRGLFRYRLGFAFSSDDWIFFSAWIIQSIQVGLLLKATVLGLGQNASIIDPSNFSAIKNYTAAATVLTIAAIWLAKISMVMLIGRLFTRSVTPYWIATTVLGVAALVQIEAGCLYPTCTSVGNRYIAYAALDIASELITIVLPIRYIQQVHMNQERKIKVSMTFSSRALVILFAGLIIWAATRIREIGEFTTSITLPVILLQIELGLSLMICAVIPSFRMIFQSSDVVLSSAEGTREPKRGPHDSVQDGDNQRMRTFGETFSRRSETMANTDTQISYVRQPTPPPPPMPRKVEHTPQHSQDATTIASEATGRPSEGRASLSSLVPSGTTGLSSKPLFHARAV